VKYFKGALVDVGGEFDILGQKTERLGTQVTESGRTFEYAYDEARGFYLKLVSGANDAKDAQVGWIKTVEDGVTTYTRATGEAGKALDGVVSTTKAWGELGSGGTLSVIGSQMETAAKQAEDAFKKTDAYFLKLLELASNEKIALIEARVQLNVAELEADTRRVEAAFASINNSITESYDSLNTLFGLWGSAGGLSDQLKLESWIKDEQKRLDELAPTHVRVPSGSRLAVDYGEPERPVLAARIQEVFGWSHSPRIGGGKVPLTLHLLSPARRPMQITTDLAGFWERTYPEVKKDLKGRYPKHYWPDDPLQAEPRRGTRPRGLS
jgi:hypothetical protein